MSLETAIALLDRLAEKVPASSGRVELTVEGRLARLHVHHPEARNALTVGMMRQLAEHVRTLNSDTRVCALLLTSAEGGAFCAGGHLREVQRALGTPTAGHQMALAMGEVLDVLSDLPVVSFAALEGPAIGGGAELAITPDFRVMGADSSLHFVHTRLGVVPGWGGAGRLVDAVGRDRALRLLLDARPLSPERCEVLEIAEIAAAGEAEDAAMARIEQVLRRGDAARAAKAAVVARRQRSPEARALEAAAFGSVWGSEGHKEALARVLERIS
ncbi:MAG: enoyl-CoA hydratase/isomerase family protein [Deltaproteobacteria bacterium]|nr:MAG: enoyl-CoA hydratase/isomerase family protein [Deltaproteobacteria bacterium]